MKEKLVTVGTLVCLFVLTFLLLLHTFAIFPGVPAIRWFFATSAVVLVRLDAPAWIQAVGSILAIIAAAFIAGWQVRRIEKLNSERIRIAERTKLLAMRGVLEQALRCCVVARKAVNLNKAGMWEHANQEIERVRGSISRLPMFEIPSPGMAHGIANVDHCLWYLTRVGMIHSTTTSPTKNQKATSLILERRRIIEEVLQLCRTQIADLTKDGEAAI